MTHNILNRAQAPEYHQITSVKIPNIEQCALSNGIECHILRGGSQELVSIDLMFDAGSSAAEMLVAQLTNTMLSNGTEHHTARHIADTFDFYASDFRTELNKDSAIVGLMCLNKYLDKLLPLFCEILQESVFAESELAIVVGERKHELAENLQKTPYLARLYMYEQLFDNHPYGRHATPADYDAVSSQMLRQFFTTHYHAGNCKLMLSGNITNSVMQQIDASIGQLAGRQKPDSPIVSVAPLSTSIYKSIRKADAVQTSMRLGLHTIGMDHPDFHKLNMLTTILGGYFGSRLMSNIREEKGYTYSIYAMLTPMKQASIMQIAGDIKSGCAEKVAHEIDAEIERLRTEPVSEQELTIVRNYMMGEMLQHFDGPLASADSISKIVELGIGANYFVDEQHTILSTTAAELQATANKYLTQNKMVTIAVGNEV